MTDEEFKNIVEKIKSNLLRSKQSMIVHGLHSLDFNIVQSSKLPVPFWKDNSTIYINVEHEYWKKCKEKNSINSNTDLISYPVIDIVTKDIFMDDERLLHKNPMIWSAACGFVRNLFNAHLLKEEGNRGHRINKLQLDAMSDLLLDYVFENKIQEEVYEELMKQNPQVESRSKSKFYNKDTGKEEEQGDSADQTEVQEITVKVGNKKFTFKEVKVPDKNTSQQQKEEQYNNKVLHKKDLEDLLLGGKEKGTGSSPFDKFLQKLFQVKINWEDILRECLLVILQKSIDLSFNRPKMAWLANPLLSYFPNYDVEEKRGMAVFVEDESGSMGDLEVQKAGSIINQSKDHFTKVMVLKHDSMITWTKVYEDEIDVNELLMRKSYGGTSHEDVFKYIQRYIKENQDDVSISVVILLTDFCSDIESTQKLLDASIPRVWISNNKNYDVSNIQGKKIYID